MPSHCTDSDDSIRVVVRVRPLPKAAPPYAPCSSTSTGCDTYGCVSTLSNDSSVLSLVGGLGNRNRKHKTPLLPENDENSDPQEQLRTFTFDNVLPPPSSNKELYSQAAAKVVDAVKRYGQDGTVFFYGQTGAGKSWSCFGDILSKSDATSSDEDGVIVRSLQDLYAEADDRPSQGSQAAVTRTLTFYEIFNERVHDLLAPPPSLHKSLPSLPVRTHPSKGSYIEGITELPADDLQSCVNLVKKGYARRAVAETKMNDQSSRSHAVVRIKTATKCADGGDIGTYPATTYLTFVDLAGSERQRDTGNTGKRLKEASSINKSLSTLGAVIFSLGMNCSNPGELRHVPFRDSKLTLLLRSSLNPVNCRTAMVMNISPDGRQFMETISTLKFAQRVKQIKCKSGLEGRFKPESRSEVEQLRKEIGRLRMRLDEGATLAAEHVKGDSSNEDDKVKDECIKATIVRVEKMEELARNVVPQYTKRMQEDKLIDKLKTDKIKRLERLLAKATGGERQNNPAEEEPSSDGHSDGAESDSDSELNVLCSEIDGLRRMLEQADSKALMWKSLHDEMLSKSEGAADAAIDTDDSEEISKKGSDLFQLCELTKNLIEEKQKMREELQREKDRAESAVARANR